MIGKTLIQVFQDAEFESFHLETIEARQGGKLRKFEVLKREWNDEKVGWDLVLRNCVPPRNWQTKTKEHQAFQSYKGDITFL